MAAAGAAPFWRSAAFQAQLVLELEREWAGAPVQKIRVAADRTVLGMRGRGVSAQLVMDARAGAWWLQPSTPAATVSGESPHPLAFQGLLRKYLLPSRLGGVACNAVDGTVTVGVDAPSGNYRLVLEWGASLVLLLHSNGKVLGTSDTRRLMARGLKVGQPYVPPPENRREAAPPPSAHTVETADALHATAHAQVAQAMMAQAPSAGRVPAPQTALRRRVRTQLDKAVRLVKALEADQVRGQRAGFFRDAADRALAQKALLQSGTAAWLLPHPWLEDSPPLEVAVDPALSPARNIERLFHTARRLARTHKEAGTRLETASAQVVRLQQTLAALDEGAPHAEDRAVEVLGPVASAAPRAPGPSRRMPFRAFVAPNGWRMLVGKGSADNDRLTHKVARGRDLFFHARDTAGAHVILLTPGRQPPPEAALRGAALLAAHFSNAHGETVVDVRYTEVKHVHRVAGTPGLVTLARERVMRVRMDDPLLAPLLASESGTDTRS